MENCMEIWGEIKILAEDSGLFLFFKILYLILRIPQKILAAYHDR